MDVLLQTVVDLLSAGRQVLEEPGMEQQTAHSDSLLWLRVQHLGQQILTR